MGNHCKWKKDFKYSISLWKFKYDDEMWYALKIKVLIALILKLNEQKLKKLIPSPVKVGFLKTEVLKSLFRKTLTSKNDNWLLTSFSQVKIIFLCLLFI